jgi:hypothetical protein
MRDGESIGVVVTDVTERRRAEEALAARTATTRCWRAPGSC